jgi:HME family heavy-metal exporter
LPPGSSLEASNESTALVDARLKAFQKSPTNPDGLVLSFARRTGRAEMDEHVEPPNATEYLVTINPETDKSRSEILDTLQNAINEEVPGIGLEVEQPLNHLISHMISGSTTDIAVKIYGDDLDTLRRIADQIKEALADVKGLRSVEVDPIRKVDEIHIRLRPADLAFYGVSRAYVGRFIETALNGEVVSQVVEDQRRFDLLVRLAEPYRADIANLGRLRVDLPDGRGQVLLSDLADITPLTGGDAGANLIKRENIRRWIVVKCNVKDRDDASVAADIKKVVDGLRTEWPEGYSVDYAGGFKTAREASRLILALSIVALIGMFFVLYLPFPSVRIVLQILNAVPAAFIGGVIALMISGQTLTVASLVGFISLGGIAARNGILLISHYLHLIRHEGEGFTENMILRGSLERLSPVLMTALTAGIALVPLVIVGQEPGREILYPVATVILGGLMTSTFCEFLLRPGLFWRFSANDVHRLAHRDPSEDALAS